MINGLKIEDMKSLFAGLNIIYKEAVDSTNDEARRVAKSDVSGSLNKSLIISKKQEKGRGTKGAGWFSPDGMSLYTSILIYPNDNFDSATLPDIPINFGKLVGEVLDAKCRDGVDVKVKIPNDILLDGKKVLGVLCESSSRGSKVNHIVIGVGMNLVKTSEPIPDDIKDTIGFLEDYLKPGESVLEVFRDAILVFEKIFK